MLGKEEELDYASAVMNTALDLESHSAHPALPEDLAIFDLVLNEIFKSLPRLMLSRSLFFGSSPPAMLRRSLCDSY